MDRAPQGSGEQASMAQEGAVRRLATIEVVDREDIAMAYLPGNTLRVRPESGFPWFFMRDTSDPFRAGDRVELDGMIVHILAADGRGVATEVEYIFPTALEDESLIWMQIEKLSFQPYTPPALGETVVLNE